MIVYFRCFLLGILVLSLNCKAQQFDSTYLWPTWAVVNDAIVLPDKSVVAIGTDSADGSGVTQDGSTAFIVKLDEQGREIKRTNFFSGDGCKVYFLKQVKNGFIFYQFIKDGALTKFSDIVFVDENLEERNRYRLRETAFGYGFVFNFFVFEIDDNIICTGTRDDGSYYDGYVNFYARFDSDGNLLAKHEIVAGATCVDATIVGNVIYELSTLDGQLWFSQIDNDSIKNISKISSEHQEQPTPGSIVYKDSLFFFSHQENEPTNSLKVGKLTRTGNLLLDTVLFASDTIFNLEWMYVDNGCFKIGVKRFLSLNFTSSDYLLISYNQQANVLTFPHPEKGMYKDGILYFLETIEDSISSFFKVTTYDDIGTKQRVDSIAYTNAKQIVHRSVFGKDQYICTGHEGDKAWIKVFSGEGSNGIKLSENTDAFRAYPNPTSGILNIKNANTRKNLVYVYDIFGRMVLKSPIEQEKIDLSQLGSGLYLLSIDESNQSQLIILNK